MTLVPAKTRTGARIHWLAVGRHATLCGLLVERLKRCEPRESVTCRVCLSEADQRVAETRVGEVTPENIAAALAAATAGGIPVVDGVSMIATSVGGILFISLHAEGSAAGGTYVVPKIVDVREFVNLPTVEVKEARQADEV